MSFSFQVFHCINRFCSVEHENTCRFITEQEHAGQMINLTDIMIDKYNSFEDKRA